MFARSRSVSGDSGRLRAIFQLMVVNLIFLELKSLAMNHRMSYVIIDAIISCVRFRLFPVENFIKDVVGVFRPLIWEEWDFTLDLLFWLGLNLLGMHLCLEHFCLPVLLDVGLHLLILCGVLFLQEVLLFTKNIYRQFDLVLVCSLLIFILAVLLML